MKAEDFAAASRWYRLGREHYPHDVKWLKSLAQVHLKAKNDAHLERALSELARLDADDDTIVAALRVELAGGASTRDAVATVARSLGVSKKSVYALAIDDR